MALPEWPEQIKFPASGAFMLEILPDTMCSNTKLLPFTFEMHELVKCIVAKKYLKPLPHNPNY